MAKPLTSKSIKSQYQIYNSLRPPEILPQQCHRHTNKGSRHPTIPAILLVGIRLHVGRPHRLLLLHKRQQLRELHNQSPNGPARTKRRFHSTSTQRRRMQRRPCLPGPRSPQQSKISFPIHRQPNHNCSLSSNSCSKTKSHVEITQVVLVV
jgi:hypothetical protein